MDGPIKRIQGAGELWKTGDKENAAILIFVGTAGISRIRYPRPRYKDREAFTKFIGDEIATVTKGATPDPITFPTEKFKLPDVVMELFGVKDAKEMTLEQIIYGVWRCTTIHEARWPDEVYLTETRTNTEYNQCIEMRSGKMGLPEDWILGLADAVEYAVEFMLPKIPRFPMYILYSGTMNEFEPNKLHPISGVTKFVAITVRNQLAVPLFTTKEDMKTFKEQNPGLSVGVLNDIDVLRNFVEYEVGDARFIFNPRAKYEMLPSYTQASLLANIRQGIVN